MLKTHIVADDIKLRCCFLCTSGSSLILKSKTISVPLMRFTFSSESAKHNQTRATVFPHHSEHVFRKQHRVGPCCPPLAPAFRTHQYCLAVGFLWLPWLVEAHACLKTQSCLTMWLTNTINAQYVYQCQIEMLVNSHSKHRYIQNRFVNEVNLKCLNHIMIKDVTHKL